MQHPYSKPSRTLQQQTNEAIQQNLQNSIANKKQQNYTAKVTTKRTQLSTIQQTGCNYPGSGSTLSPHTKKLLAKIITWVEKQKEVIKKVETHVSLKTVTVSEKINTSHQQVKLFGLDLERDGSFG